MGWGEGLNFGVIPCPLSCKRRCPRDGYVLRAAGVQGAPQPQHHAGHEGGHRHVRPVRFSAAETSVLRYHFL